MSDTDLELLARYTRGHAEDAFSEIVRRHLDLVHSAALRQVRSQQLAEEVAQATFIKLAGHAHRLAPDTILTAWLYQVTRRESIDVVRREARRQLREQIATEMHAMNATTDDWTQIEPLLDDAMHALDDTDRTAVLLRFFENKSLREVGQTLGTTDDTARKRVNRAIEHLREFFAKRGVTVGASGLVLVLGANAVQAAPAGLAATLTTASLASAAAGTGTTLTLLKFMAMAKLKLTAAAALFAVVLTPVVVWQVNEYRLRNAGAATPCDVDLSKTGQMRDIVSNVLLRAEPKPTPEVQAFLHDVQSRYATGDDLLKAAAEHFKIDQQRFAGLVEHWRHINCKHAAIAGYAVPDAEREATTGETLAQEGLGR